MNFLYFGIVFLSTLLISFHMSRPLSMIAALVRQKENPQLLSIQYIDGENRLVQQIQTFRVNKVHFIITSHQFET